MKKLYILLIFFLTSCSSQKITNEINFSNTMTIEEFKLKLTDYAETKPYPNINN